MPVGGHSVQQSGHPTKQPIDFLQSLILVIICSVIFIIILLILITNTRIGSKVRSSLCPAVLVAFRGGKKKKCGDAEPGSNLLRADRLAHGIYRRFALLTFRSDSSSRGRHYIVLVARYVDGAPKCAGEFGRSMEGRD